VPAPDGYLQTPFGGWMAPDGSGPFAIEFASDGPLDYVQLPSGFWTRNDGSGPYFYEVLSGIATLATDLLEQRTP
jgi:hypothetical protein